MRNLNVSKNMNDFKSKLTLRTILVHGVLAGIVAIGGIILGLVSNIPAASTAWFGYLSMLIALSLVFVGVKRVRDTELGGVIGFIQALLLGLMISLIAALVYAAIWEVYITLSGDNSIEPYLKGLLDSKLAEGISGAELEEFHLQLASMREQYSKPLNRFFITMMEIAPVGLLVSMFSAGLLRNSNFLPSSQKH